MLPPRDEMVETLYHYKGRYSLDSPLYKTSVIAFMNEMLGEDLSEAGCITGQAIFSKQDRGEALISAKQEGILAGLEEVCLLLDNNLHHLRYRVAARGDRFLQDGDRLAGNEDPILYLTGSIVTILELERTILNVLQRMSGIATEVYGMQQKISGSGSKSRLAATRKLQWGRMDKRAFIVGGGLSHRRGLYDTMMIKDTEIDFLKFVDAQGESLPPRERRLKWVQHSIECCWAQRARSNGLIVEVQTRQEAVLIAQRLKDLQQGTYYPCSIMLDNFSPDEVRETLRQCREDSTYEWTLFESSGNINDQRLLLYAQTGIDVISSGKPTHSTNVLDIHMIVE